MKVKLPTVMRFKQFNVRIPEDLRTELTQLREECERRRRDFNAAVTITLRQFAEALRTELAAGEQSAASDSASKNASEIASENDPNPLANGAQQ